MRGDAARLGNRLKLYRARAYLTQGQLADVVSVSRRTINSVENCVFVPSTELALRLARALDATVEELFFLPEAAGETS